MNAALLRARGWPVPTADEMARIDRFAIEQCGLPGRLLMENAGRAVARAVRRHYPHARRPLVVCGAGNNGGDGYVIARVLAEWDAEVRPRVVCCGDPARGSPESRANFEALAAAGVEIADGDPLRAVRGAPDADLIVDALFGVGLTRPIEGALAELIEVLTAHPARAVAVDLPSGMRGDGVSPGAWLEPDRVVTLGLPKLALALAPQPFPVEVADIGLPARALREVAVGQHLSTAAAVAARLPSRPLSGHKGTFGHVLVVGGSEGKTGAPCLAAEGALRAGAGLVTAGVPRSLHAVVEEKLTEAMSLPLDEGPAPALGEGALKGVLDAAAARDTVVLGPGLGDHPQTAAVVGRIAAELSCPCVIDADGLNAFAGEPRRLRSRAPRVLTPHPGEAARLLGRSTAEIQADRCDAARTLAAESGCVVLLKGARSLIASPRGEIAINPTGGPALATGGTGDVLAGVVGALLAGGCEPFDAACVGAYLHGLAGGPERAVGRIAGEVARALPAARDALLRDARAQVAGDADHGDDQLRPFP